MVGRREQLLDDKHWREVEYINSYAAFIGYLSMAIKGLGFLVITWTTVVLLGGFVSDLHRKDFWCLTFITLVQTAGIFDVDLNEKLGYMKNAADGLLAGVVSGVLGDTYGYASLPRFALACVLVLVQLLVLVAALCPLAIMYVFGIVMSGGISLWRLIEHDYGGNSDGEGSNLAPAMDTLYYLALIQGILFCYRFILARVGKRLPYEVACTCSGLEIVYKYLGETKRGCEKDPSFAKGRNLITSAVDKIGSSSPVDCVSGVKMLYTTIRNVEMQLMNPRSQRDIAIGQHLLMKHLVMSASSSRHVMQILLETLDSRGLYDRETRYYAAVIVERLAFNINLEEFPRGIQHISSLIGTLQEYCIAEPYVREYEQHRYLGPSPAGRDDASGELDKAYKDLLMCGLCILRNLAADGNNCRVMSDTPDLVSKIMAPVTYDLLHHTTDDHGVWSYIVVGAMQVMIQLTCAPGETGAKLRREISRCEEAISTLQRIISCNKCQEVLQQRAFSILARLYYTDITGSSRSTNCFVLKKQSGNYIKEEFVRMLVDILTHENKYSSYIRANAGTELLRICFSGGIGDVATIVIRTCGGDVVDSLTKVLVHDKNEGCRQAAAGIFENLCTHYTKDDECPGKLKKAVTDAMPKVLGEIIHWGDKTHTGKEAHQDRLAKPKSDIENQCDGTQENDERDKEENKFKADVQPASSTTLLSYLLSLCATVYNTTFINSLSPQLDASRFLNKLQEVVVKKSDPTAENLLLCKATGKMAISMMKFSIDRFIKQEDLESLIKALSDASKRMLILDHSMVFRSINIYETPSKLDRCTLASLVKEVQELHAEVPSTSMSS